MDVIKNLSAVVETEEVTYRYFYRVVKSKINGINFYGIEAERQDFKNEIIINSEKDFVRVISTSKENVICMAERLKEFKVSPVHLIDIIGEEVDNNIEKLSCELNEEFDFKC